MGAKTKASVSTDVAGNGEIPTSTEGLVAQWNFNESNGDIARSEGSCGKQCNGQLINFAYNGSQDAALGTGWTAKNKLWSAGSLMFDGVNDLVKVSNINAVSISGFTWEAWVKPSALGGTIISSLDEAGCEDFYLNSSGSEIYFNIDGVGCKEQGAGKAITSGAGLVVGQWYHITGTRSYTENTTKIYVNGVLRATTTATIGSVNRIMHTNIGGLADSSTIGLTTSSPFNGTIDAVRIYSRALSEKEILTNFQAQNGITPTPPPVSSSLKPVGEWKFDEETGNTVADSSGNGNNGTWAGTGNHWTDGKVGKAGNFNGRDNLVKVNNSKDLDINGVGSKLTIEMWLKPNSLSSEWQNLVFKGSSDTEDCQEKDCSNRQYTLWLNKDGFIHFTSTPQGQTWQNGGNTPSGLIKIGEWYHVAVTIDSVTGQMRTYINGKQQWGDSNYPKVGIRSTGGSLSIGNRPDGSVPFNGTIDAVRIYSRALSEKEILANFQARNGDRLCGKEVCKAGYECYQPPPPPLLPCETGKPCPVYDQLPPSCRPITTPTPPQSLTATPVPSGTPNASSFLFKVRMPDVSQSVGTVKDVKVLISNKPGTLYDFTIDLQRVQGTDFFAANPIELDIPDGSYLVSIKQAKSLSRTFTVRLSKGKTLDCTQKNINTDCQSFGRPELAPLYSGDSDGLVDTKINNGVRANSYNVIDSNDLQKVVAGYGLSPLPPEPNGDFNLDGKIDVQDLGILGKNFGKRGD